MKPYVDVTYITIWLLALSCGKCSSLYKMSEDATVVRENYGVTFHKQGILDNAHSVWHQTFIIPLEATKLSDVHLYCVKNGPDVGNSSISLQIFCPALSTYNERHRQLRHDIQSAEENIYRMLQENNPLRARRAILGFVGRFA